MQQHPVLCAVCVLKKCDFGFAALLFTSAAHKALPIPEPLHNLKLVHTLCQKGFIRYQEAIMQQQPVLCALCILGKCDWGFASLLFTSAAHKALPLPEPLHILKLVHLLLSKGFRRYDQAIMQQHPVLCAVCVLKKCDFCFAVLLFTSAAH